MERICRQQIKCYKTIEYVTEKKDIKMWKRKKMLGTKLGSFKQGGYIGLWKEIVFISAYLGLL